MSDQSDDNTRSHAVLNAGTVVGSYKIVERIGAGGMGEVYLAEDTDLHRQVAIKFLPQHMADNEDVRTRFLREARAVAKLNHPNVVTIHNVAEYSGRPFFVMEHIEGQSLHHFAHDEPLPMDTIVDYTIQICQGLADAHRAGIVHRDVKAANIVIDKKGRARILDFGLATRKGEEGLTKTGSTLGTVSYMSPEQVSAREIDLRSDLFSLGIVIYELLAGRTPFRRDNEGATLKAIIEDEPEPLTRYKAKVPEKLQAIVTKLLEKDKELRYQSAEGVIADLKRMLYDSQQTGRVQSGQGPSTKRGLLIGMVAAAIIVVVAAAVWWIAQENERVDTGDSVPRIAVLPFDNLGDPNDEYFAEGMTDEITSQLAKVTGIVVISRASTIRYKESLKTLKQIGDELGIEYAVEGTVRWSVIDNNPRVRITPELIRISDNRHLWGENYERELLGVFDVQAEIASRIVEELGVTFAGDDRDRVDSHPTKSPGAYAQYLRALALFRRFGQDRNADSLMRHSIDSALVLDSNFALAYALKSRVYSLRGFLYPNAADKEAARKAAIRALELDPQLPQAHLAMGQFYNLSETDYDRAMAEFDRAKSELHNDADLVAAIALAQMRQGKFMESQKNFRKATQLDPLNEVFQWLLSQSLWLTCSFDETSRALDRAIALSPKQAFFWQNKIAAHLSWHGDWGEAREILDDALGSCDSLDILSRMFFLNRQFPNMPWRKYMVGYRTSFSRKVDPTEFFRALTEMTYCLGDSTLMRTYADSARIVLERKLSQGTEDFHSNADLGLVLSRLGDCEGAINYGEKGVDQMPVEKCHW